MKPRKWIVTFVVTDTPEDESDDYLGGGDIEKSTLRCLADLDAGLEVGDITVTEVK